MALISVGIDHEHASLDFLERATVVEADWTKVLRTLISHRNIHEAVFLSTCLRTEVVATIDLFHGAIDEITETLAVATGIDAGEFEHRLSVHFDRGVAAHLFRVAAGLQSVVPGEFEILGQLRRALELALEEQTAGPELDELFRRALATGRRVRTETAIARGTTSFAHASADLVIDELGEDLRGAPVVVVGAGQLATGVVKSLLASPSRLARITLVNRTRSRAESLRRELDDERVVVGELAELATHLKDARLCVVAVEVLEPIITRRHLESRATPLLVLDLGLPRAVAHDVAELTNVRRVDIGDLRSRVERALGDRREAVDAAEAVVATDVEKFVNDQRARGASVIVRELRERFDDVVAAEMGRRQHEMETWTEEQHALVRSVLRSVVAKIAHRPTMALKDASGTDQGARLTEATRNLFDL